MPVSVGATTYKFRGKSSSAKGDSALSLFKKILGIQKDVFEKEDGGTIKSPARLQYLIDETRKGLDTGLAKDEGDKLDMEGWISGWEAEIAGLKRNQSKENISYEFDTSVKDSQYNVISQYADSPLDFLKAVARNYYALWDLGTAEIDNLESSGRLNEANALKNKIKDASKEVEIFNEISSATESEDSEKLKNYAVVYRTDSNGNVVDMGWRKTAGLTVDTSGNVDDIGNMVIPLVDKDSSDILIDGVKVFVNKQNEGGFDVVKLGGQTVKVGRRQAGYDEEGNPILEDYSFQQSASLIARLDISREEFYKNSTIAPATLSTVDKVGTYAITSSDEIFRFNQDFQWDEIAPDALKQFGDYNEKDAIKVPDIDSDQLKANSGKVITEADLMPMSMRGEPVFKPEQNMTPATSFTGQPMSERSMLPVGNTAIPMSQTNRELGMQRYSGQEQFNIKTGQLFSGKPSP